MAGTVRAKQAAADRYRNSSADESLGQGFLIG